ncbi:hypothetical protein L1987_24229 [Smallanthus sonchifolius]|uniref:Uncharacterized protein n=1 Tax=Smallanthus sonchifolius TaxID=185202 RepID=A0ACB9ILL2_9ASTR|nr:hypothetical protein L1987_24229 [Smallanthus sonchifolius]
MYGSSLHPNNSDKSSMKDYILGVSNPEQRHSENLKMNRDHYASWMASLGGAKLTSAGLGSIGIMLEGLAFLVSRELTRKQMGLQRLLCNRIFKRKMLP